jgi:hypothetical protein
MTKSLWLGASAVVIAAAASGITWVLGMSYVPSALMFVAAILVLGLGMTVEDRMLARYDTPHDDDTHPPRLILLRAVRAVVLIAMGIAIFAMML